MEKQENKWHKLYENYISNEYENWEQYFKTKMKLKTKFLKQVLKHSKDNKRVLECGCGTGKFAVYLASLGKDSFAMDLEEEMVQKTKALSRSFCPENQVTALQGDIRSIPYENKFFSVTHSSGVLEHYDDEEIVKIINEQLRVSEVCVFSVPSPYFENKMYGNERFMKRKVWRKIIECSNAEIIKETGYPYKTFKNRFLDIIKKPAALFKPVALYVFVLKSKN